MVTDGTAADQIRPRAELVHARLLSEARGLRGPEEGAHDDARPGDRGGQGVGAARARRRRLPDRHEVAVRRQEVAEPEVHRVQCRRERAGHVQGSPADGAQPAPPDRRVRDCLLRHRREGRLHLHSRRVLPRAAGARARHRRSLCRRVPRPERPRLRFRLRRVRASRRGRVRGRRGDRAARVARGQARAAAQQAAVSRGRRPLQLPDGGEQRRDARQRPADRAERRRMVRRRSGRRRTAAPSCTASAATCGGRAFTRRR